jgi:hypothetical protein
MGIYIDYLVVNSKKKEDLITNLEETFWNLKCYRIMLNPLKCIVSVEQAKYSGYLVSHLGIEAAPKMVEAVLEMNLPRDHREIKKLAGYL